MPSGSFSKDSSPLRLTKMLQRQSSNPDTLSRTFWEPNFPEHIASGNTRSEHLGKKRQFTPQGKPGAQPLPTAPGSLCDHLQPLVQWDLGSDFPGQDTKGSPKSGVSPNPSKLEQIQWQEGREGDGWAQKTYCPRRFLLEDPNPLQPWQEVQPHVPPQRQVL